jgi:hypothetical protein
VFDMDRAPRMQGKAETRVLALPGEQSNTRSDICNPDSDGRSLENAKSRAR